MKTEISTKKLNDEVKIKKLSLCGPLGFRKNSLKWTSAIHPILCNKELETPTFCHLNGF